MKFDIGAMSVGDILDRGLKVLFARLPTFFAIYLLILAPLIVIQSIISAYQVEAGSTPDPSTVLIVFSLSFVFLVLYFILPPIGTGAILHVIGQEFVGRRVGAREAVAFALGRFGSLFGTGLLTGAIVLIGWMLCCVPGIVWGVWYIFYAQVVVMEQLGGMNALKRSKGLVSGFGWRIFGVSVLLFVVLFIAVNLPSLLEFVLPAFEYQQTPFGFSLPVRIASWTNYAIEMVISLLVAVPVEAYYAICMTLFYFDLRIRKEGFDLELAARQQAAEDGEPEPPARPEQP